MLYTALVLLTGFYLGIGFSGYISARAKLAWRYNVAAHVLMTFLWGIFGIGALWKHVRYWAHRLVVQRS